MNKEKLAEFLGWHLGDGCLSTKGGRYQHSITGDIIEEFPFYRDIILPTFNELFEKKNTIKKYKSNNVCGVYSYNKEFVKFLMFNLNLKAGKKINIEIPKIVKSKKQKIAFLRGLFDTDGSIFFCKSNYKTKKESLFTIFHYKPKIKLATISEKLINQVFDLLCKLDYYPMLCKPARQKQNENIMYGVILHRKQDIQRWIQDINFKNLKHLTKIQVAKKYGFCPPKTTLKQRLNILSGNLNPLDFYQGYNDYKLEEIKKTLLN